MPYATPQQLVDRFGEVQLGRLADRDRTGELDAAVLSAAIADADQEIDAYLATRYRLPLDPVPGRITALSCDIAFYRLHAAAAPDDVRKRYEDALRVLRDLADGRAALDQGGLQPETSGGGSADYAGPPRVFDRRTLEGF